MKRLLTLALTSVISVSAAFAAKTITPSVPALDSDGCYAISTAEELYGFVKVANSSSVSLIPVCAKLTADIVVNENVLVDGALNGDGSGFIPWSGVNAFYGSFDGAGHKISGLYFYDDGGPAALGLFETVMNPDSLYEVKIENLTIEDSYFSAYRDVGAVIGRVDDESQAVVVRNCHASAFLQGPQIGGLVGGHYGESLVIENSHTEVIARGYEGFSNVVMGGLLGDFVNGKVSITNSYSISDLSSDNTGTLIGLAYGEKLTLTNVYGVDTYARKMLQQSRRPFSWVDYADVEIVNVFAEKTEKEMHIPSNSADSLYPFVYVDAEKFSDGSVAWLLHNYVAPGVNGTIWGQNVGVDSVPNFSGSVSVSFTTSHINYVTYPEDTAKYRDEYVEGIFMALPVPVREGYRFMGWYTDAELSGERVLAISEEARGEHTFYAKWWRYPQLVNGCYEIGSADELYTLIHIVKDAHGDSLCTKLTADIVANESLFNADGTLSIEREDSFTEWESLPNYHGVFDGAGHTISGLYGTSGFIGDVENGSLVIKNLGIIESYIEGRYSDMGGLVSSAKQMTLVIANSYYTGVVDGHDNVGGLVGLLEKSKATIIASYCYASVSGMSDVGGLVGFSDKDANSYLDVMYSYSSGFVAGYEGVGGLVGDDATTFLRISNSYNVATVYASSKNAGGLVGYAKNDSTMIYNSYNGGVVDGSPELNGALVAKKLNGTELLLDSVFYDEVCPYADLKGTAVASSEFADKTLLNRLRSYKNFGLNGNAWGQSDTDKYPVLNFRASEEMIDSLLQYSLNVIIEPKLIVTSSSSVAASSSSVTLQSSDSTEPSNSSAEEKSSSSKTPKSSSSVKESSSSSKTKSSSSATPKSSDSGKTSLIVAHAVSPVNVRGVGRMVEIFGMQPGDNYALLDMQGRLLQNGVATQTNVNLNVNRPGRYLVRVSDQVRTVLVR